MRNLKALTTLFTRVRPPVKHFQIQRYSLYEPDYLEGMKSKIPLYDTLNIQLKGYDFPILENYQRFVHTMARNMEVNVEDAWAVPAQHLQIVKYKPQSEVVDSQYNLKIYERTVQITDVSAPQISTLLRLVEASCPVGVTVDVVQHDDWHDKVRYVPDNELIELKQKLDDMARPVKKK